MRLALVASLSLLPGLATTGLEQDAWLEASRSVPNGPLTVARLGLMTKCYGPN